MPAAPFDDRERIDARAKVMGSTPYAADVPLAGLLYAMTVPATIAKGRVTGVPIEPAMRVPGVVRVLTAADFPTLPTPPPGPAPSTPPPPTANRAAPPPPPAPMPTIIDDIAYKGQPIALVVAETLEAAIEGAEAIRPTYAEAAFVTLIDSPDAVREPLRPTKAGDASVLASAPTTIDAHYVAPAQHHNPIELLSTTAVWKDGKLIIYEGTQGAGMVRQSIARSLRIDQSLIEVKSPYIGGAFGQKGVVQRQSAIVARAAMLIGRPVKLVMPRAQIFHNASFRPRSRHHVTLAADASGKLAAIRYDADHQQSRKGTFVPIAYHESPARMYGAANYDGTSANVRIDTPDPGPMRAPHPHPAHFAFESAVDELAYKLERDPVAFRLAHRATVDPLTGHPLSSCFLNECLTEGAKRFGWERRTMTPGSMTLPDGTMVGWGVAGGAYPGPTTPTIATLRITAAGDTRFAVSGHEMGQGMRTMIAQILERELGIRGDRLEILIGDTEAAPQHLTAGSWGTASVAPITMKAAVQLKAALAELAGERYLSGSLHQQLAATRRPSLQIEVTNVAPGQDATALDKLRSGDFARGGPAYPQFTTFSYIAHFVEVRVEPRTRRVRVPRVVSICDGGRIVSPRTAASQVRGGVVMGIGSALREETEVDPRYGGWFNADLADYVVPVNADIGDIDVGFVDLPDPLLNAIGAKGVGEVSMVGAAAAVANAVFHATGKRIRKMPIRIEDII